MVKNIIVCSLAGMFKLVISGKIIEPEKDTFNSTAMNEKQAWDYL